MIELSHTEQFKIHVSGDILFVGETYRGLHAYHLPTLLAGSTQNEAKILHLESTVFPSVMTVVGPYLIVGGAQNNAADALMAFDLSNLATLVATYAGSSTYSDYLPRVMRWGAAGWGDKHIKGIAAKGSLLFLAVGERFDDNALEILDLQTPLVPVEVERQYPLPVGTGEYNSSMRAFDRFLFVRGSGGIRMFDMADVTAPLLLTTVTTSASSAVVFDVRWPYLYVANTDVRVYDLTETIENPGAPWVPGLKGSADPGAFTALSVAAYGSYLFTGADDRGVYSFNSANAPDPTVVFEDGADNPKAFPTDFTTGSQRYLDLDPLNGVLYVTVGDVSGSADQGWEAIALRANNFATSATAFPMVDNWHFGVASNGPRRGYVWGGRLYGSVQAYSNTIVLGAGVLGPATVADPIELSNALDQYPEGGWSVGGSDGRYIYSTGTSLCGIFDSVFEDAGAGVTYDTVSYIAGPNDLADSAAVGPFLFVIGRPEQVRFFDLEY